MIRSVTKSEGSITIFHLKDDLDTKRVKAFAQKMNDLVESGRINLVMELSEVHEICLLAQVTISSVYNRCRQSGGSLKLAGLTEAVREQFCETNLINTVEVYESALDAVKSFSSSNLLRQRALSGSFFIQERNAFVGWDRLTAGGYYN